jgi:hypothetical protein
LETDTDDELLLSTSVMKRESEEGLTSFDLQAIIADVAVPSGAFAGADVVANFAFSGAAAGAGAVAVGAGGGAEVLAGHACSETAFGPPPPAVGLRPDEVQAFNQVMANPLLLGQAAPSILHLDALPFMHKLPLPINGIRNQELYQHQHPHPHQQQQQHQHQQQQHQQQNRSSSFPTHHHQYNHHVR